MTGVLIAKNSSFSGIPNTQAQPLEKQMLRQLVDQAREHWQNAREYFEFVSEPELVDVAITNLEAAERRYVYLLKQLREA